MADDDRIAELEQRVARVEKLALDLESGLRDLHDLRVALLDVPPGSGADAKPLLEEVRGIVRAYQRASWATRAAVWGLPTLAGLGVAVQAIAAWFARKGG